MPSSKRVTTIARSIGWLILLVLAVMMFLVASRYLTLNPDLYFPEQKAVYIAHTVGLMSHILGAMIATLIGPFLFLSKLRSRAIQLHRWFGRLYVMSVLVGGLGGIYLSFIAYGGLPTQSGFMTLGILWLFTAHRAYHHIRHHQIELHRQWMIRNYALTFAGVTLRLWQIVGYMIGLKFLVAYSIVAWLSWIPNLLVAEWMIRRNNSSTSSVVN